MNFISHVCVLVLAAQFSSAAWGQDAASDRAEGMTNAAKEFLNALGADQRAQATFEFENEKERRDWSNLPSRMHPRGGISFGEMTDAQRAAAYRLLETGLSTQGYFKASGVMRLDEIWKELMNERRSGRGAIFGSDKYWVALFGEPGTDAVWGWQFDGHHLAINVTSAGGELSLAPMFFGAEPDIVPSGTYAGWRIFGAERHKGFALANALTPAQVRKAVLSEDIPPGIFEGPGDGGALSKMEGITAADLTQPQRALLWNLIDEYLDNAPHEVAEAHRERVRADGEDTLHFAWMGPIEEEANFYFRVHGPSILIEYDNTFVGPRTSGYSNHLHTILREPSNDFGEDLLRRHYAESDHHKAR